MAACEAAALEKTPEALAVLAELMQSSQDDRVRTRCAEILIERGLGKPQEAPPEAVEGTLREHVKRVEISFVAAEPEPEPAGPVIDATPTASGDCAETEAPCEPARDEPEPPSPARPVYSSPEEVQALEARVARIRAEIERLRREGEFAVDDEFSAGPQTEKAPLQGSDLP